jgi:hypothetical protein
MRRFSRSIEARRQPSCAHVKVQNMKVMMIAKACQAAEAGLRPTIQQMTEMGKFNEELLKAARQLRFFGARKVRRS